MDLNLHDIKVLWRKDGAAILLFLILLSFPFSYEFSGFFIILMVTTPCSNSTINTCWYYWYPRQLYFIIMGGYIMFS